GELDGIGVADTGKRGAEEHTRAGRGMADGLSSARPFGGGAPHGLDGLGGGAGGAAVPVGRVAGFASPVGQCGAAGGRWAGVPGDGGPGGDSGRRDSVGATGAGPYEWPGGGGRGRGRREDCPDVAVDGG